MYTVNIVDIYIITKGSFSLFCSINMWPYEWKPACLQLVVVFQKYYIKIYNFTHLADNYISGATQLGHPD